MLVLYVTTAFAVAPTTAHGQCVTFDRPAELFALSDAVFVGTVVSNEPTYSQGDHVIVSIATVRMDRSWKGRFRREVQVGSDRALEVGKQYVVFAAGKPLSTSVMCRWSEPLNQAKRKLDWLSVKRRSTG
jgi:hypothetical protein